MLCSLALFALVHHFVIHFTRSSVSSTQNLLKMAPKGEVWTDEETLSLINAWSNAKILAMMQETNRNSKIYS